MIFQNSEKDLVNFPKEYKPHSSPIGNYIKLLCSVFLGYRYKKW